MTGPMRIPKTYKLFINGAFPRSESGRSLVVTDGNREVAAHLCNGSRKDLRDAVDAARGAAAKWASMTGYNRGQILYRMAEMLDGRRAEFAEALEIAGRHGAVGATRGRATAPRVKAINASKEVDASVDRLISFAGWCDKHAEVLGRRAAVSGAYHVFSLPEPSGVTAIIAPDAPALLGLVALLSAVLAAGNPAVCLASELNPIPAALLGEVVATSDVPAGVVNILTGRRDELLAHVASHREIRAISAADLAPEHAAQLRSGAAENLKRVHVAPRGSLAAWLDDEAESALGRLEPFVEIKTIWHPSAV